MAKLLTSAGLIPYFKFFNLKKISDELGIQPDKLYNNFRDTYNSLNEDKERIATLMIPQVTQFFDKLGFNVRFTKKR